MHHAQVPRLRSTHQGLRGIATKCRTMAIHDIKAFLMPTCGLVIRFSEFILPQTLYKTHYLKTLANLTEDKALQAKCEEGLLTLPRPLLLHTRLLLPCNPVHHDVKPLHHRHFMAFVPTHLSDVVWNDRLFCPRKSSSSACRMRLIYYSSFAWHMTPSSNLRASTPNHVERFLSPGRRMPERRTTCTSDSGSLLSIPNSQA